GPARRPADPQVLSTFHLSEPSTPSQACLTARSVRGSGFRAGRCHCAGCARPVEDSLCCILYYGMAYAHHRAVDLAGTETGRRKMKKLFDRPVAEGLGRREFIS